MGCKAYPLTVNAKLLEVPVPVDANLIKITDYWQSPMDLKSHIQRMFKRCIQTNRGLTWSWGTSGSPLDPWETVDVLSVSGQAQLLMIFWMVKSKNQVWLRFDMDGQVFSNPINQPVRWEEIFGTVPTLPCQTTVATLLRYDTTEDKYVIRYEPSLIGEGYCMDGILVRLANGSDTQQPTLVQIHYGLPSSVVALYKLEQALQDIKQTRKLLAETLGIPLKQISLASGYNVDENDNLYPFLDVSIDREDIELTTLDQAVGSVTEQTCQRLQP